MHPKKQHKLKEGFTNYDPYISLILSYILIGIIIKWYNDCKNIFVPVFLWPYLIVDYFLKKIESDAPAKYCYSI